MSRLIRVFPRKTKATPDDDLAIINRAPELFDYADEVHISVAFTYDLKRAEELERVWRHVAPVKIGGPAVGDPGGEFEPGKYLKRGYVITSRGCPNRCWFCPVWRREGTEARELSISDGWIVQDDNLLSCSRGHIESVFAMLKRSKRKYMQRVQFTGGLEAARLEPWHVDLLREVRPKQIFFAYDTPDDLEPLIEAGRMLLDAGWTTQGKQLRCYVLCGYPGDTFDKAGARMLEAVAAGFTPMAMIFRDKIGKRSIDWVRWSRQWARPALLGRAVSSG